jgi:hypothetical protein
MRDGKVLVVTQWAPSMLPVRACVSVGQETQYAFQRKVFNRREPVTPFDLLHRRGCCQRWVRVEIAA